MLAPLHEVSRDPFRVAQVDLGAGRSRRAEGKPRELELGGSLARALADQIHGLLAHGLVLLFAQHLEAVGNGTNRTDHIVADAA